eukprot:scaffold15769_cov25-Tisochrysis_lutea.AAC.1
MLIHNPAATCLATTSRTPAAAASHTAGTGACRMVHPIRSERAVAIAVSDVAVAGRAVEVWGGG